MAALVETMFSVRETPWHGLGTIVAEAPDSQTALGLAGLDWNVLQKDIITADRKELIHGFKANVRDADHKILGIVTDRYKVVQNREAFAFTDALLGEGVRYETAGSLQGGKRIWILAKLPQQYQMNGEEITPYLVFMNSHDGSAAMKVAMTPIRVVCNNTLNLALSTAKRSWSCNHTGNIQNKMEDARNTLLYADKYMSELGKKVDELNQIKLTDRKIMKYVEMLLPESEDATLLQKKNVQKLRADLKLRYFEAPDLIDTEKSAYRFINAVSDFATHVKPLRERSNYKETLFAKTVDGNPIIDKAYQIVRAAA